MKAYTKRTWDVKFRHILSYPFIYSPVICFILLDIVIELYHHICFPLYSIPKVDRSKYILIDRHHLSYINFVKKV